MAAAFPGATGIKMLLAAVHEYAVGPERHLLRDSNTSEIGGQSGNGLADAQNVAD
jgi:hypothetical protein